MRDGEILTACQQTCPTQAITFGDLKDGRARVSQALGARPRGYHVLEELSTRPAVTYLKKVVRGEAAARGRAGQHERATRARSPAAPARPTPTSTATSSATLEHAGQPLLRLDVRSSALIAGRRHLRRGPARSASGMGMAGKRTPQMWAMYITTFVFWVGIGHAGTLISAILFLFRAQWRTSIYRGAEAMTVFAVMTAGLFPIIHIGRMWFAYWLLPYPNQRYLWPNFKSPLVWDVFAISTYLTISAVFFIVGLVPDIAALRDAATGWQAEGSTRCCRSAGRARTASGATTGAPTALRGARHAAGALGAQRRVLGLRDGARPRLALDDLRPVLRGRRHLLRLRDGAGAAPPDAALLQPATPTSRDKHLDAMAKLILVTSLVLTYFYACEVFTAWYSGEHFEQASSSASAIGHVRVGGWPMIFCNSVAPLVLFWKRARTNPDDAVRRLDPRADRDVVRALQHHRPGARPRLLPVHVGHLLPDARPTRRSSSAASPGSSSCSWASSS